MAAVGTIRLYRPDPAAADELQRCGTATFVVRHPSPTRVAVAVLGDVDAVNARYRAATSSATPAYPNNS